MGTLAAAACLLGVDVFTPGEREPAELVLLWGVMLLVWLAGFGLRRYEVRTAAATRRAVEAEVTAATEAMQAVVDERTRIARELIDIVAHAVSSMVVQAGAAEQDALEDPRAAQQALESIRAYGADALVSRPRRRRRRGARPRHQLARRPGRAAERQRAGGPPLDRADRSHDARPAGWPGAAPSTSAASAVSAVAGDPQKPEALGDRIPVAPHTELVAAPALE